MTDHWLCKMISASLLRISNHTSEKLTAKSDLQLCRADGLLPGDAEASFSEMQLCCHSEAERGAGAQHFSLRASQKVSQSSLSPSLAELSLLL